MIGWNQEAQEWKYISSIALNDYQQALKDKLSERKKLPAEK